MRILRRIDAWVRGWLSPDRKPHDDWTIARTPEEMAAWRELPDPKPSYYAFVGLPEPIVEKEENEDEEVGDFVRSESGAKGTDSHKVTYSRKEEK